MLRKSLSAFVIAFILFASFGVVSYAQDTNVFEDVLCDISFDDYVSEDNSDDIWTSGKIIRKLKDDNPIFKEVKMNLFLDSGRKDVFANNSGSDPFYHENQSISSGAMGKNAETDNNLFIVDGRLKMAVHESKQVSSGMWFTTTLAEPITDGYVKISFDFSSGNELDAANWGNIIHFTNNDYYAISYQGSNFIFKQGQGKGTLTLVSNVETNKSYHFDMLVDIDRHLTVVTVSADGEEISTVTGNIPDCDFTMMRFDSSRNASNDNTRIVYLDNIRLTRPDLKLVSTNIAEMINDEWEGKVAMEPETVFFEFNAPMDMSSVKNIVMYANGDAIDEADITLSDDGCTVIVNKELSYSTSYTIEIPEGKVKSKDGLCVPQHTFKFHTKHESSPAIIENGIFTDSAGNEISSIKELDSVIFKTDITSVLSTDATIILVLYDESGVMKNAEYNTLSLAADEVKKDWSVKMNLPEGDKTDWSLVSYIWDNFNTMRIIGDSASLTQ